MYPTTTSIHCQTGFVICHKLTVYGLFSVMSMRYLYCKNNKIKTLPDPVENLNLVSCVLHGNHLTELPREFFRRCSGI
ncbi:unnamed protein product [Cylicostephanus goldi]|uniref:Uncharacterized protein n=1 Tax=Cylicostephanus goldi TaxID=71465 RepID=A0A3P6T859_CYLGO|nr:unnamed protein product [Cylicostephanus goldi]